MDTSVWGGYFDKEFADWTAPFIEQAQQGRFTLVVSDVTLGKLLDAPVKVRNLPDTVPAASLEVVKIAAEHLTLANHYVNEGALTAKFYSDAQHIALATILKVDSLVSWNFKHMVNFFRIRQYNSINLRLGHQIIDIRTPKEVTYDTDKEQ